jgi:peptide/nickel transport system ATP-binding protein
MTSLNPLMPCGKQVIEVIQLHQNCSYLEAEHKTIELFTEVKLPNPKQLLTRYPHELSGGQKQRVMIAMAISCKPSLLIADEPTTALDVTVQRVILDLLKELQLKYNMAILFITHDLNLVRHFADYVAVMYKGNIVEYNATTTIFEAPTATYTKGLLACRPSSNERVKYLKTVSEIMQSESNHDTTKTKPSVIIQPNVFLQHIEDLKTRPTILSLKDLHVWYPIQTNFFGKTSAWYKAVNGIDLDLHEGETIGLVGESGCGKTTIGKTIVKLNPITTGNIYFKGKSISSFSKSELADYRKKVQIIFQDPYSSLNPRVTIGDAIKEPMIVHGLYSDKNRKEKVIELLTKVDLKPEHYDRYPHEFSGGQRQRICIARALALEPECMICDESVSALDVSVQAQVLNLLVKLREEFKLTYLFISHDMAVVKHICDNIAVMHQGKILEFDNSENLYKNPKEEFTQKLLRSISYSD